MLDNADRTENGTPGVRELSLQLEAPATLSRGGGDSGRSALSFHIACVPPKTSHHAKKVIRRGGFLSIGDKPELQAAKQTLEALLLPHQPAAPFGGPISLWVTYTWPWLAGHAAKVRALGRIPHTSPPDLDNVTKTLADRLATLRFIEADQRIVDLHVRKWWGDTPGIAITIQPFQDGGRS